MVVYLIVLFLYWYSWIPYPLIMGYTISNYMFDNVNFPFILLLFMLFPFIEFIAMFECKSINFMFLFNLFYILIYYCFIYMLILLLLIYFECIIMMLYFIMFCFIPSYYSISSAYYLFIYSLIGLMSLMMALVVMIISDLLCIYLFIIIPFYIKIPGFPFYAWLPEVHCEVNCSISLLLDGIILKIGMFGIISFILSTFFIVNTFLSSIMIAVSISILIIISMLFFSYFDFKKMIAFSSIIHLNLVIIIMYSMSLMGYWSSMFISISHAFSSINFFYFNYIMYSKCYTSYIDCLYFIDSMFKSILLLIILSNLSFPGSFNFMAELLALINISFINMSIIIPFFFSSFLLFSFFFLLINRNILYTALLIYFSFIQFNNNYNYMLFISLYSPYALYYIIKDY